ncbi:MAG: hypothetical protein AMJ53_18675 [Gammaproteobacteria bacterium SG8_11]|nr:MAG: hypothetical protein AMJ53_18675 [Gammaproteobacteria bacterium SG8_11]
MADRKEYTGSVYIGVVGGDLEYGAARDSIHNLLRRPGDGAPVFLRATKGYEARQMQVNRFLESPHAFMLLLDHDMVFAADTLERLRAHKFPYVTGAYMRRQIEPAMAPVWFKDNPGGEWPHWPETTVSDELTPVGASGWGCVLIHREVVLAVRALLNGEWEILEDDMDLWPYDLRRIMAALNALDQLTGRPFSVAWKDARRYVEMLREEIRPLTGDKSSVVGSDIRFPYFARQAGYQLMLDPAVTPKHILHYGLQVDDFLGTPESYREEITRATANKVTEGRTAWHRRRQQLRQAHMRQTT